MIDQREHYKGFNADVFIPLTRIAMASLFAAGFVYICTLTATEDGDLASFLSLTLGGLFACIFGLATFARNDFSFFLVAISLRVEEFRAGYDNSHLIEDIRARDNEIAELKMMISAMDNHVQELELSNHTIRINSRDDTRHIPRNRAPQLHYDPAVAKDAKEIMLLAGRMKANNTISISRDACAQDLKMGKPRWGRAIKMLINAGCVREKKPRGFIPAAPYDVMHSRLMAHLETLKS